MALQCLYFQEMSQGTADEALRTYAENFEVHKNALVYARQLVKGVNDHADEIDGLIRRYAVNWRLSRIAAIDRAILRIAIYEFCFAKEVPKSVAINEAIEIAKRYSTDDAGPFVNGILDAIEPEA